VERRRPLPKVLPARRIVQWVTTAVVVLIGVRFTQWVVPHLDARWPTVDRPPGVEAFLPIGGMLATRHLPEAGVVDAVHPADLAIFLEICLMSLVVAVAIYCSVVAAFRVAGHWRTQVTEAEYHARLQDIHSPAYVHPGVSADR